MKTDKPISAAFNFESNYLDVKGSKMHYVDVGKGDPILFLHGNPTSSYLWRNIIPYLQGEGRCLAPDLIGMGKSDQPNLNYGFQDTYDYLEEFISKLGLKNVTLVIHDWGSALGFHYANKNRENIKAIAFMESLYVPFDWNNMPRPLRAGMTMMRYQFTNWLMLGLGNFFVKKMLPKATHRELTSEEKSIYGAPYPNIKSRKPIRRWPQDIPKNGKPVVVHNAVAEYHEWLKTTNIPKLCIYATPGMMIKQKDADWIGSNFPNTAVVNIGKGLHFVQEDQPDAIGETLREWYVEINI